jgi:F-type H+-transporting ATPase subunit alpha
VSRVGGAAQITPLRKVAGKLKLELSQYRDLEAFAQFGSDLDADTQKTLARGERLVATLNQGERQPMPVEEQVIVIYAATSGYIDRISVDRVPEFHRGLIERARSEIGDVLKQMAEGDWSEEVQKAVDKVVAQFAEDFGYDIDEDGAEAEQADRSLGERATEDEDDDSESGETSETEEKEETAGAAA